MVRIRYKKGRRRKKKEVKKLFISLFRYKKGWKKEVGKREGKKEKSNKIERREGEKNPRRKRRREGKERERERREKREREKVKERREMGHTQRYSRKSAGILEGITEGGAFALPERSSNFVAMPVSVL
jgi:hypothetical protein